MTRAFALASAARAAGAIDGCWQRHRLQSAISRAGALVRATGRFDPGLRQAFGVSGSTGLARRGRCDGRHCPAGSDSAGASAPSTKPARAEPDTSQPTMRRAEAPMMTTTSTRSCQLATQGTSVSHPPRDQRAALLSWNRSGYTGQPGGIPTTCPTWDHEIGAGPGPSGRGCRGSASHGVGR